MRVVTVNASKQYDIKIGSGILHTIGQEAVALGRACKVCIISDDNVFPIYGSVISNSLKDFGFEVSSYIFPAGEESKNGNNYLTLVNTLALPSPPNSRARLEKTARPYNVAGRDTPTTASASTR